MRRLHFFFIPICYFLFLIGIDPTARLLAAPELGPLPREVKVKESAKPEDKKTFPEKTPLKKEESTKETENKKATPPADPIVEKKPEGDKQDIKGALKEVPVKDEVKEVKKEPAKVEEAKGWEIPVLSAKKSARDSIKTAADDAKKAKDTDIQDVKTRGDTAWMLTASAFVMLMLPGLALFYGGMVRKKNILATMMQSYAALAVVGLYWIAFGYALAFGPSAFKINLFGVKDGGIIGWSSDLVFLRGINSDTLLPFNNITVYAHVMFQGMFAIITPALISGALAERIRFWPFCIFMILWVTFVYCPLAHMVWAFDWFYTTPTDVMKTIGESPIGLLGKMSALDFAGGTVVHIAAGTAGLSAALVLRKRVGYPEHAIQPNSMVLTLLGAGLLWFGWFGFNGGSAVASNALATSAFSATQAAAAAAGFSWIFVEWLFKGKPTALGMASGIVAGLVAVTPASGYVPMWGGAAIGLIAGVVCYFSVMLKSLLGYDDSLDAFGVHAVGGFLGAVLTGIFCYTAINSAGADGYFAIKDQDAKLAELRILYPDAATLYDIDDLDSKITKLKAEIDSAGVDEENARIDLDTATGDLETATKAKPVVAADITKATDAVKKAKETLADAQKKQKDKAEEVKKAEDEKEKIQKEHKKSKATLRVEKIEAEIKEKTEAADKAKEEATSAGDAYNSAADAARRAEEKGKGADVASTKKAFATAKDDKEKKEEAYKVLAVTINELAAEKKKLVDDKDKLKKLEEWKSKLWANEKGPLSQFFIQLKAAIFSFVLAFVLSMILAIVTQLITLGNFTTDEKKENEGLDLTEHGEIGFDFAVGNDAILTKGGAEPRAAKVPPGQKRFELVIEGIENGGLLKAWNELCLPSDTPTDADFKSVYPYITTVQGNRFRFRGGDPAKMSSCLLKLLQTKLGKPLKVRVEE